MNLQKKVLLPVANRTGDIDVVMTEFAAFARVAEIPPNVFQTMNIVLDELVSNVLKYGYDDDGEHAIEVDFRVTDDGVEVEIVDDGHAFNMLEIKPPDTSLGVLDRSIGGLGIHMVRKMTDEQRYTREGGRNHNFVRKHFPRTADR